MLETAYGYKTRLYPCRLLVVIAIIAVLWAILLPSLTSVKNLARRLQCSSRLSGIGKAMSFYADKYDGKLPTCSGDAWISPTRIPALFP